MLGFTKSEVDANLYHIVMEAKLLIIFFYVDDISMICDNELIKSCKEDLAREFEMKDMGLMHYFLGREMGSCLYFMESMPMRYSGDFIWRAVNPWRFL